LARYAALHPQVRIELEDALSEDGIRAVQKGSAELAVIGDNVPREGLEVVLCDVDELVLLVPNDHGLAQRTEVGVQEALGHDQVALARSASLTRKVIGAAETAGLTVKIRVQVRSFDAMCRMVASGLGVAVLPRTAAALYEQALGLKMLRIDGADMERRLLLAMRQRSQLSSAALALVELIEA
jgi:DNA-binding transcriptional LysR family regulator